MEWLSVAVAVLVPAVSALLAWNWSLTQQITELRVSVAGQYHSKSEIAALLEKALEPVNRDLEEIKRMLYARSDHHGNGNSGRPIGPQFGRD